MKFSELDIESLIKLFKEAQGSSRKAELLSIIEEHPNKPKPVEIATLQCENQAAIVNEATFDCPVDFIVERIEQLISFARERHCKVPHFLLQRRKDALGMVDSVTRARALSDCG